MTHRSVGLEGAMSAVRRALEEAAADLPPDLPRPPLSGKLLRPVVAWAATPPDARAPWDPRVARGALAVQMAHEASLLHDDIVDGAHTRRGEAAVHARLGVGPALVQGDHLLTAAYRVAAGVGSAAFLDAFVEAVERTVAGEIAQGRAAGTVLDDAAAGAIVADKSGALFGCVVALPCGLAGGDVEAARAFGRRLGSLYQRVDDLLDYCPATPRGKPPLQDWRQRKWTWVLDGVDVEGFTLDEETLRRRLFGGPGEPGVMTRAVMRLEAEAAALVAEHGRRVPADTILPALLGRWTARALQAVGIEAARAGTRERGFRRPGPGGGSGGGPGVRPASEAPPAVAGAGSRRGGAGVAAALPDPATRDVAARARAVGGPEAWSAYFGRHARSFHFAARLFPPAARARVSGVYAFCRFTDDLVDEAAGATPADLRERLEAWRALARRAYGGARTDVPLLDVVLGGMAAAGVPFRYADELLTGVGMDLGRVRYRTMDDLDAYAARVAGGVGGWITELFGERDPGVLDRAYDLGIAMQITNVVRDVGEDWRAGRLYLPARLLAAHGLDEDAVAGMAAGGPPSPAWPDLVEALLGQADARYERALRALPALPPVLRRPVAVAARVYQGIHGEVRRNGYDVGTRRAHTSLHRKLRLALRAAGDLRRAAGRGTDRPLRREASGHA